jgi:hypothetical protein
LLVQSHQHATTVLDAVDAADYSLLDYSTLPGLSVSLASVLPANHVLFQQNYFRAGIQFRSATPNGDLV